MKTWIIKKGKHYASGFPIAGLHTGKTLLEQKVTFTTTCLYEPYAGTDSHDWNKGCGMTYGFFNDKNSIRWAWRQHPNDASKLQVGLYVHEDGKTEIDTPAIDITPGTYRICICYGANKVVLAIWSLKNELLGTIMDEAVLRVKWGYINKPYFGGNNPARKTVYLYTEDV